MEDPDRSGLDAALAAVQARLALVAECIAASSRRVDVSRAAVAGASRAVARTLPLVEEAGSMAHQGTGEGLDRVGAAG